MTARVEESGKSGSPDVQRLPPKRAHHEDVMHQSTAEIAPARTAGVGSGDAASARAGLGAARGFRPASRRNARIAAGVAIAAVAVAGNVLLYASLDDTTEVVQMVASVRAGERIEAAHVRIVSVDVDGSGVPTVAADELGAVIGQYAVTFLPAGLLLTPTVLQPEPLVAPGSGIVAVPISPERLPAGISNRARVHLVLADGAGGSRVVEARVVAQPDASAAATGDGSLSVEVAVGEAAAVASADDVRVVLVEGGSDPAIPPPAPSTTGPVPTTPEGQ
jgi:hypothetical protein